MNRIVLFLLLFFASSNIVYAEDYRWIRTYDANGQVVSEAKYEEWISITLVDYNFLGYSTKLMTYGYYTKSGNDWVWNAMPNYQYSGINNGWYIFVCTVAYHSEYCYVRSDLSIVRSTFMAGGNGFYKEYVRAKRPTVDVLAPTR